MKSGLLTTKTKITRPLPATTLPTDRHIRKRVRPVFTGRTLRRTAATYSPTWSGSTIGDDGLSFSVRNGKRRFPVAIATALYNLRENSRKTSKTLPWLHFPLKERSRAISTGQLRPSPALHFLPIDVVVSHDPLWKSHLGDGFALRCFQRLS